MKSLYPAYERKPPVAPDNSLLVRKCCDCPQEFRTRCRTKRRCPDCQARAQAVRRIKNNRALALRRKGLVVQA